MALLRRNRDFPQTCAVCGSPDSSCGGAHATNVTVVEVPEDSVAGAILGGPVIVEAWAPSPSGGRMKIRATPEAVKARGYELVEAKAEEPKPKAKAPAKSRTAKNKARTSAANKSSKAKSK